MLQARVGPSRYDTFSDLGKGATTESVHSLISDHEQMTPRYPLQRECLPALEVLEACLGREALLF